MSTYGSGKNLEALPKEATIRVIGVGGGGGNALNTMIASNLKGVDFLAANTDLQALRNNAAPVRIHLGAELTKGLGAGANPSVGAESAHASRDEIARALEGADMVFVTAGMGGGTGTGGAPVIAEIARSLGALTVGVVTKPFSFEGKRRMRQAEQGIIELKQSVDTLITIHNQRLLSVAGEATTMLDAFKRADEVLLHAVQGISDLVTFGGQINVDFADVRTVMSNMGMALMGTGRGRGEHRALDATRQAINSPLLEDVTIDGATGILLNITSGPDITLMEVNEAAMMVHDAAHEDVNLIFGWVIDESMTDEVKVTVIATGFDVVSSDSEKLHLPARRERERPAARVAESRTASLPRPVPIEAPQRPAATVTTLRPARAPEPDLDTPTHIRRAWTEDGLHAETWEPEEAEVMVEEEELDVPTFLRRHKE